jgi:hypothetical protein
VKTLKEMNGRLGVGIFVTARHTERTLKHAYREIVFGSLH